MEFLRCSSFPALSFTGNIKFMAHLRSRSLGTEECEECQLIKDQTKSHKPVQWMTSLVGACGGAAAALRLRQGRRPGHGQGVGGGGLGGQGRRDGRGADLGGRETAKLSGENGLSGCQRVPQVCRPKFERPTGVGF